MSTNSIAIPVTWTSRSFRPHLRSDCMTESNSSVRMKPTKGVNADQIRVHKILPGGPVVPAQVPNGTIAFYNDAPFMDVGFGDGSGDLWAGVKFNLLSERMGSPLSLAIQPIARFHLTDDREHLARGLTAGATDWGFDFVLSK